MTQYKQKIEDEYFRKIRKEVINSIFDELIEIGFPNLSRDKKIIRK